MASYVDEIVGSIPVPIRQLAAGVATIPSETGRFVSMLANPARTYRQFTGATTPEDSTGVAASIQDVSDRYNAAVNEGLQISDPSPLDDTGNALARFAGNALPRLPVAALSAAPAGVRALGRLAEVLTPVTVTSKSGGLALGARAANTIVPTAAAGAVEKATETRDPTQVERIYDADGNLQETIYPVVQPGLGRAIANPAANALSENPGAVAAGAAGALGLALLARRANSASRAVREEVGTSGILKPLDPTANVDRQVPGTGTGTAAAEVLADQNITAKSAVRQALPNDVDRARVVNSIIDNGTEQAHKSRVTALRRDGIIETPEGVVRTIPLDRLGEELTLRSRSDPTLKKEVDEFIEIKNAIDEREYHQRAVDILLQEKDRKGNPKNTLQSLAEDRNVPHIVAVDDTSRPIMDANGQQMVVDNVPQFEKNYIIARPSQHNMDLSDLRREAAARDTPRVREYYDKFRTIHDDVLKSMIAFKALDPKEVAKMIGQPGVTTGANPHYRHTTNIDEVKSPFTSRMRGHKEGPEFGGDPWAAAREYQDHALSYAYDNMRKREMFDALLDARDSTDAARRAIGNAAIVEHADPRRLRRIAVTTTGQAPRSKTKADVKLTGDIVRYRDGEDLVEVQVGNKSLYHTAVTMPRHAATIMGTIKSWAESGMTGKIATLMGQPFALANATMGAIYGMISRPKSLPLGIIDRTVMGATGGRFGVRGDPTAYVGMTAQMAKNVGVVMARAFSESLKNSIAANGTLAKLIPNADRIADQLADVWRESMYARQFRSGAGEVNMLGGNGVDLNTRGAAADGMEHTEQARVVNPASKSDFRRYMAQYGKNSTPAAAKITWRVLGEIQQAIANAPTSYAYASNLPRRIRNMTEGEAFRETQKLSAEVRQLLGDPAMRGSGLRDFRDVPAYTVKGAVGYVLDATPYGNIGVQAIARFMRAYKDNPLGTTGALAMTLGPVVILPILHAYNLDKERMARGEPPVYIPYELMRQHYHASRIIKVHIDGAPPEDGPEIRNDPFMGIFVAPLRWLTLGMLGVTGNPLFETGMPPDATAQAMEDYVGERFRASVTNAAINATPISQLPPLFGAGMAAMGVEAPNLENIVGRGGARMIQERGLAGYDEATLQGSSMSKWVEAMFGAFFPGVAATGGAMLTAGEQAERRSPGTGVGAALGELAGRSRDRLGELNGVVWERQARRHSTTDPVTDMVNAREAAFARVEANYRAVDNPGTIGSGDYRQMAEGGGVQGVSDPRMVDLLSVIHKAWSRLKPQTGERTLAREQLLDVKQKGIPDFIERRRQENAAADRVREVNHRLLAQYHRLEHELSIYSGYRIRLDRLDPSKPITQFDPIR